MLYNPLHIAAYSYGNKAECQKELCSRVSFSCCILQTRSKIFFSCEEEVLSVCIRSECRRIISMDQTDNQAPKVDMIDSPNGEESTPGMVDEDPSMLARTEVFQGKFPGQERVRIIRPSRASFRQVGRGLIEAREISAPRNSAGKFLYSVKRTLIGAPIATARAEH